ncbi:SH3 domain-containing protein [Streptomyces tsukubensis]|uniref:SH3 domain-containing protein n=1 Tax=Streptomyces tsukubensis TaxID=83656 RepID=A0A1V4A268_9ACTN|nr:SH3 domain-containing protein [Streptomyces tsukubensis]OON73445.1 hypothetical protein B1H18_27045 [Streptomyces tsukubensis]QFR96763.1 hypothetical protein GBW32_31650 [Streptomyces tsukubensis]
MFAPIKKAAAVTALALAVGGFTLGEPAHAGGQRQTAAKAVSATPPTATETVARSAAADPGRYLVDGARIHSQASTSSSTVGYGYTNHSVNVSCRKAIGDHDWYYHTDTTTNVTGWGRDDVIVPFFEVGYC